MWGKTGMKPNNHPAERPRMQNYIVVNRHRRDINPLICGYEACVSLHSFGPATRDYFLFHFVLSGRGVFEVRGKTYTLSAGHLFLIRPGEVTMYTADADDPWRYVWVGFDGALAAQLLTGQPDVCRCPQAESLFRGLMTHTHIGAEWELFLCAKIYELFSLLAAGEHVPAAPPQYVERAESYMKANYINPIRVEEIAAMLGVDRRYLCALFKKKTGQSPKQYLMRIRMERARELLSGDGLTVAETAHSVGYEDVFTFSKMFKKYFGYPPRAVR